MNQTPPPSSAETTAKLFREICIFFVFLGLLLGGVAYLTLTSLGENAAPLWGFPRNLAIGVPLATLAVLHLLCGLTFAILRTGLSAIFGAVASTLIPVLFFAMMITTTGEIPVSIISAVIVMIPVVVWIRVAKYLSAGGPALNAALSPALRKD